MPIYEYLCESGHRFDAMQKFADPPLTECESCGKPVQRVLHPVAVHFKGSGFYATDYGRKKRGSGENGKAESASSETPSGDAKKSDSTSSSTTSSTPSSPGGSSSSSSPS
jgi:putative FmdB family regulatory protein